MNRPLLSPGSCSDDDTISVVAHQGSTQSYSSQRAGTGNVRNSWRSSTSSSTSSSTPVGQAPTNNPSRVERPNSFRSSSHNSDSPVNSPDHPTTSAASKTVKLLSLSGDNILRVASIGCSQDSDEVAWSNTLGADDAAEDFPSETPTSTSRQQK